MRFPHVTCVMTAFNYERYVAGAIHSVLAQDYPPELLDVVVVDDGSTDGTADTVRAIEAPSEGRVALVQQENAGLAAATNTALEHAQGELVAICDADDEWLPGKVRAQAEIFASRPEVSLVYGDMQIIDEHGSVLDSSFFRRHQIVPRRGRLLDELVGVNFTTNSTLMLRAQHVTRIPPCSPYADYWLVMHAAAAGELEVLECTLANYRLHSSNMSFGASGQHLVRELTRELTIRRLLLTGDLFAYVAAPTLVQAALEFEARALAIGLPTDASLADVLSVTDADRDLATAEVRRGCAEPDREQQLRAFARARLLDPFNTEARAGLEEAMARPRITVADARELISDPQLVVGYCAGIRPGEHATLVILAAEPNLDAVGEQLRESLISVGVDPDDCPDMSLVPASVPPADYVSAPRLTAVKGRPS